MRFTVAFTGASGLAYGKALVDYLLKNDYDVDLIISNAAYIVAKHELDLDMGKIKEDFLNKGAAIHGEKNLEAPVSSGTYKNNGMVICPCSMATLGQIASGISNNLIGRAADVTLKEKRRLILVPRETPLNLIHINNMATLTQSGAIILPAMPGFYNKPKSIEDMLNFIVGKILDCLEIEHSLYKPWPG
jgi:4-hydroxy-3-polyprenylbenzoate decarboxylase